jgi:predicted DNA-binding transcriptional regulator AlpA
VRHRREVQQAVTAARLLDDLDLVDEVAPDDVPALLCQLTHVSALLATRMAVTALTRPDAPQRRDELLKAPDAAHRLGMSVHQLYRSGNKLPFVIRQGRSLRFSSNGIDEYIRKRSGA